MHLIRLKIDGFRCYESICIEDIPNLLFLVGENDVGKTGVIDAVEMLIENKKLGDGDFREGCDEDVSISATFALTDTDAAVPVELRSGVADAEFCLTLTETRACVRTFSVIGKGYSDSRLNVFGLTPAKGGHGAPGETAILKELGITNTGNKEEREEAVQKLLADGVVSLVPRNVEVQWKAIAEHLPRIERTSSEAFDNPASLILSGLQTVARSVTAPADETTGQRVRDPRLQAVHEDVTIALNEKVASAEERLRDILGDLKSLKIEPEVSFDRIVSKVEILIDMGEGERSLGRLGQGTNRRMWMGLLEWQREAERDNDDPNVLYLFDEPDTALHYGSQRRVYDLLRERAEADGAQCIVCTHSVHLIDRAPADSICLIERDSSARRTVRRIQGADESSVRAFMNDVGHSLGLSNTALLYEKAFLLVEGDSEREALPVLYRTLYGRSYVEDGIHIVNLHTCGSWKTVLEVLFENRMAFVHLLLDMDCTFPDSGAKLTPDRIREAGGDEDFLSERVSLVGLKELEDAFPDDVIVAALNADYPREDEAEWEAVHLAHLRAEAKFSKALHQTVKSSAPWTARKEITKPSIAKSIAVVCTEEDIPGKVKEAFRAVRSYADLT